MPGAKNTVRVMLKVVYLGNPNFKPLEEMVFLNHRGNGRTQARSYYINPPAAPFPGDDRRSKTSGRIGTGPRNWRLQINHDGVQERKKQRGPDRQTATANEEKKAKDESKRRDDFTGQYDSQTEAQTGHSSAVLNAFPEVAPKVEWERPEDRPGALRQ